MKNPLCQMSKEEISFIQESIHTQIDTLVSDMKNASLWKYKHLDEKVSVMREESDSDDE